MERHPWLLRLVRGRLDPATATGLALTLALGLAILGGLLVGAFAYLVRSSDTLVDADRSVGQWGVDHASAWSTDALQLVTELGSSLYIVPAHGAPGGQSSTGAFRTSGCPCSSRRSWPARSSS